MKFEGQLYSKSENPSPGHSTVNFKGTVDIGDGVQREVILIFSTPDLMLVDHFPRGANLTLESVDPE